MAKISNRMCIRNSYAEWLSEFEWSYYATLTTRYRLTMKSARKAVEGLHKQLSKAGNAVIFFAIEPYDVKEGYHIHALILCPNGLKYQHVISSWQHVSGNKRKPKEGEHESTWNRVELQRYNPKLGARHYVGKYIMKDQSDYDFLH